MRKIRVLIILNLILISGILISFNAILSTNKTDLKENNNIMDNCCEPTDIPLTSDDSFEENDFNTTATFISMGYHPSLSCEDDDWYRFYVNNGEKFFINIYFMRAIGELRFELYDRDIYFLDSSYSRTDEETINWTATYSGEYYVKIYNLTNSNTYDLDIYTLFDEYEPNDDFWNSVEIFKGMKRGLWCEDDDWYKVEVKSGELINFEIYYDRFSGDIDLELYDRYGTYLGRSDNWDKDFDILTINAAYDGFYHIRVYGKVSSYENWYDLKVVGQSETISII
jgi:hypothetical protein